MWLLIASVHSDMTEMVNSAFLQQQQSCQWSLKIFPNSLSHWSCCYPAASDSLPTVSSHSFSCEYLITAPKIISFQIQLQKALFFCTPFLWHVRQNILASALNLAALNLMWWTSLASVNTELSWKIAVKHGMVICDRLSQSVYPPVLKGLRINELCWFNFKPESRWN